MRGIYRAYIRPATGVYGSVCCEDLLRGATGCCRPVARELVLCSPARLAWSIIFVVEVNRTVECAHCEAQGTCHAGEGMHSCDECRVMASTHLDEGDFQHLKLVSCSKCS